MGKFLNWLFEPVVEIFGPPIKGILEESNIEHKIKPIESKEVIVSTIKKKPKSKVFRPATWEEYIGQEKVKDIMKSYIEAMIRRKQVLGHVLIHGQAGTGKTTLAEIIANELKVKIQEIIGGSVSYVPEIFNLVQKAKQGVVFIDEVHALSRDIVENLYPLMEDFKVNDQKFKKFTLIGATTELGEIIQNRKPFYDRFKIIIELDDYTIEEMAKIVSQYKNKMFPEDKVQQQDYAIIAANSRGIPRWAIRLLEARVYLISMKQVLKNFRIIEDGYTEKDLKTMQYIAQNDKGVGMQSIATYLGTSVKGYLYEIEPYLLQTGMLVRTVRGRRITDKGVNKIKMLEKMQKLGFHQELTDIQSC